MTNTILWVVEGADPYRFAETFMVGEGCSPLGRRHEVTVGDSPDRGNVREADKRVAVLA